MRRSCLVLDRYSRHHVENRRTSGAFCCRLGSRRRGRSRDSGSQAAGPVARVVRAAMVTAAVEGKLLETQGRIVMSKGRRRRSVKVGWSRMQAATCRVRLVEERGEQVMVIMGRKLLVKTVEVFVKLLERFELLFGEEGTLVRRGGMVEMSGFLQAVFMQPVLVVVERMMEPHGLVPMPVRVRELI